MQTRIRMLGGLAAGLFSASAWAAPIAAWDTSNDSSPNGPAAADVLAADVLTATLALGPGLDAEGNSSSNVLGYGADSQASSESGNTRPLSLADSISKNDYFSVVITPTATGSLSFGSVAFNLAAESRVEFHLLSNLTGFTENDAIGVASLATEGQAPQSISLDVPALQGVTTPVEFRFYVVDPADQARDFGFGTRTIANDPAEFDLVFNAIPEPATALSLLTLGGMTLLRRRGC